jgi:hypothetical protein
MGSSMPRTVEIAGVAGLLHWATLPTACAVNGGQAGLAMVYGPEPNRTGRIDCDPHRQGTAPGASVGNSLRALAATYRSTYGNAPDTLALTGRMTIRESTRSQKSGQSGADRAAEAETARPGAPTTRRYPVPWRAIRNSQACLPSPPAQARHHRRYS